MTVKFIVCDVEPLVAVSVAVVVTGVLPLFELELGVFEPPPLQAASIANDANTNMTATRPKRRSEAENNTISRHAINADATMASDLGVQIL